VHSLPCRADGPTLLAEGPGDVGSYGCRKCVVGCRKIVPKRNVTVHCENTRLQTRRCSRNVFLSERGRISAFVLATTMCEFTAGITVERLCAVHALNPFQVRRNDENGFRWLGSVAQWMQ